MNYGWAIVSKTDQWPRSGPVTSMPIVHKKHFLRIVALGGIIRPDERGASLTCAFINTKGPQHGQTRALTPNNYFKLRIDKHWVYKPTREEKEHFDTVMIQEIMDV